jgi:hypothetical protein
MSITDFITYEPRTVKEIAALADLSESRVRELIKPYVADGTVTKTVDRPAAFFIDIQEPPKAETIPADETPAEEETWKPYGEPGTFLGDSAEVNEAGEVRNKFTKEPIKVKAPGETRKLLNPQPVINRKKKYVAEKTIARLEYLKEGRSWVLVLPIVKDGRNLEIHEMTGKEFSETSEKQLVKIVRDAIAELDLDEL